MLDPKSLHINDLPSVSLEDKKNLPASPGIYFAIDSQGTIQYIGRSSNIKKRWLNHHKKEQLNKASNVRIAYLLVSEVNLLIPIEKALIEWFQPPVTYSQR